jgi:hypothetical protein
MGTQRRITADALQLQPYKETLSQYLKEVNDVVVLIVVMSTFESLVERNVITLPATRLADLAPLFQALDDQIVFPFNKEVVEAAASSTVFPICGVNDFRDKCHQVIQTLHERRPAT